MISNKIDEYLVYGIAAALLYITWKVRGAGNITKLGLCSLYHVNILSGH
jgi:hypothetical protein